MCRYMHHPFFSKDGNGSRACANQQEGIAAGDGDNTVGIAKHVAHDATVRHGLIFRDETRN